MKFHNLILPSVLTGLVLATSANAATNLISNGDFETGDLTGWTYNGTAGTTGSTVVTTGALDGTYSLKQVRESGHNLSQNLSSTLTTGSATVSLDFKYSGGTTTPGSRFINVIANGSAGQISLRVDGGGTLQFFDNTNWVDSTINDLSIDTLYTMTLQIDDIGGTTSYGLTVSGLGSQTGITDLQGTGFGNFEGIRFASNNFFTDSTVLIDNVSVVVPEPSAALLGGLGLLALLRRRR